MGKGMYVVGEAINPYNPYHDIFWMLVWIIIIAMITAIIVYVLISPLRKHPNVDNEKLIKIEKDVEEIKEIVKELKKKWEEIE